MIDLTKKYNSDYWENNYLLPSAPNVKQTRNILNKSIDRINIIFSTVYYDIKQYYLLVVTHLLLWKINVDKLDFSQNLALLNNVNKINDIIVKRNYKFNWINFFKAPIYNEQIKIISNALQHKAALKIQKRFLNYKKRKDAKIEEQSDKDLNEKSSYFSKAKIFLDDLRFLDDSSLRREFAKRFTTSHIIFNGKSVITYEYNHPNSKHVALVLQAISDYNGAFKVNLGGKENLLQLSKIYSVKMVYIDSNQAMVEAIDKISKNHSVKLLILNGHGESHRLIWKDYCNNSNSALTITTKLPELCFARLHAKAKILLISCSTGKLVVNNKNLAQYIASQAKGREVRAPQTVTVRPRIYISKFFNIISTKFLEYPSGRKIVTRSFLR